MKRGTAAAAPHLLSSTDAMKVLFIAPLPEPLTGHSLACKILRDDLVRHHTVLEVDTNKASFASGMSSLSRIFDVVGLLLKVSRLVRKADIVYLTISESVAGNLKDLATYAICYPKLAKTVVHLHGGTLRKAIFDRSPVLRAINRFFISRLGAVIVLGDSHRSIFSGMVDKSRVVVVPNFAEDDLFLPVEAVRAKFSEASDLKVLFLSNLIEGKGHDDLVEAYLMIAESDRARMTVDFAGAFEDETFERAFAAKAGSAGGIRHHGVVAGAERRRLLREAHILCLPTSLSEGQPLSILEAYASGCVVVTTLSGGIPDVFADTVNGFCIPPRDPASIARVLAACLASRELLLPIALRNQEVARERFTVTQHLERLSDVFHRVHAGQPHPANI